MNKDIVCWWSGGVTSAVACKIAIDLYGLENCRFIFIDTKMKMMIHIVFFERLRKMVWKRN